MKCCTLIIALGFLFLVACQKETTVEAPVFDVTVSLSTIKAGDSVEFTLSGNPDIMTFYSGEAGSDYAFKDKERIYGATTSLSFQSAKYAGDNDDCAALKYSTDFSGVYEPDAIRQATWIDISERFNIPDINGTSAVMEASGERDITDLFPDADTPIYFGWFFTTNENSGRTRFQVRDFEVIGVVAENPELSAAKYNFVSSGFTMVKGEGFQIQDHPTTTPRVTETAIIWDGVFATTSFKEGWAVSLPIYGASQINLGSDYGTPIKALIDPPLTAHSFTYEKPGTYTATFVATNASVYEVKENTKQITIIVTP